MRACAPYPDVVHWLVGVILLVSFAHQPITLGLVYGDPVQRTAHRRIYLWAPLVAAVLIVIGLNISFTLVAVLAALWNAEHTLMQRYGVMRIYGRKAGDDHGRLEKPMLIAWLITALLFIAAYVDLEALIRRLGLGRGEGRGRRAPWRRSTIRPPCCSGSPSSSPPSSPCAGGGPSAPSAAPGHRRCCTRSGTFGLVVTVMIDPLAGIAGYVAAHSIEYFGIVHSSLRTRRDDAPVARAARTGGRRTILYTAYLAAIVAVVWITASPWDGQLYAFAVLFLGALHIFYDGFVWKLRPPRGRRLARHHHPRTGDADAGAACAGRGRGNAPQPKLRGVATEWS